MSWCRNTQGGKSRPCEVTVRVIGRICTIQDGTEGAWIVTIRPRDPSTWRRFELLESQRTEPTWHAETPPPFRSCLDRTTGTVWVSWPKDPTPPDAFRPGARVRAHVRCTGYHAFPDGHGFVWRIERVDFVRESPPCLFSSTT